jgi:hypothetical protein
LLAKCFPLVYPGIPKHFVNIPSDYEYPWVKQESYIVKQKIIISEVDRVIFHEEID